MLDVEMLPVPPQLPFVDAERICVVWLGVANPQPMVTGNIRDCPSGSAWLKRRLNQAEYTHIPM